MAPGSVTPMTPLPSVLHVRCLESQCFVVPTTKNRGKAGTVVREHVSCAEDSGFLPLLSVPPYRKKVPGVKLGIRCTKERTGSG